MTPEKLQGACMALGKATISTFGMQDPRYVASPMGFLRMLLAHNWVTNPSNLAGVQAGKVRNLEVSYYPRGLESEITDVDDCESTPAGQQTFNMGPSMFRKTGIWLGLEELQTLCDMAEGNVSIDGAGFPTELYERMVGRINVMLESINKAILLAQKTKFGVNFNTGSNAPTNLEVSLDKVYLDRGYTKLLADLEDNLIPNGYGIVGSGIIRNLFLATTMKTGANMDGMDYRLGLGGNFFYDRPSMTAWGENQFGAFAPNSVKFIDVPRYVAPTLSGLQGTSFFFQLPIPMDFGNGQYTMNLDAQLKFFDCPTDLGDGNVQDRGWALMLSKTFGLFTAPTLFKEGDPMHGTNGTLLYTASAS